MSFKAIFNTSLSVFVLAITFISVANATEVDLGFDSQYVTEGRQQLDKGGIYWVNASGQYDENFSLGVAYGLAADSAIDYDELNIYLEYADAFAGVQYAIGYTRLEFLADSENDNELTLALAYTSLESVTPFSNITYSTQSNGFFVNLGVRKSMQINPLASITPHILVAYDYGYAGGDKDGYNHLSIGVIMDYEIAKDVSLSALAERTFAGSIIKRGLSEGDEAHQFFAGLRIYYVW